MGVIVVADAAGAAAAGAPPPAASGFAARLRQRQARCCAQRPQRWRRGCGCDREQALVMLSAARAQACTHARAHAGTRTQLHANPLARTPAHTLTRTQAHADTHKHAHARGRARPHAHNTHARAGVRRRRAFPVRLLAAPARDPLARRAHVRLRHALRRPRRASIGGRVRCVRSGIARGGSRVRVQYPLWVPLKYPFSPSKYPYATATKECVPGGAR